MLHRARSLILYFCLEVVRGGVEFATQRFVEQFRSSIASSRSSFVWLAWSLRFWVLVESPRWRRDVAPLFCAESTRFFASSPRLLRYFWNSSTPSSTLRIRSATCPFVNGFVCADVYRGKVENGKNSCAAECSSRCPVHISTVNA